MNEEKEKERRLGFGVGDWGAARVNDDEELGSSTETPARLGHPRVDPLWQPIIHTEDATVNGQHLKLHSLRLANAVEHLILCSWALFR